MERIPIGPNLIIHNELFSKFLEKNPEIPECQRSHTEERISEIYDKIINWNKTDVFPVPYLGFLSIGILNKKWYILDGQHRYFAYKKFHETFGIPFKILYVAKTCNSKDELRNFFRDINNNYDPQEIILDDKSIDNSILVKDHINKKYSKHVSNSESPRLSNINLNKLVKLCNSVESVETLNQEIYDQFKNTEDERIKRIIIDANLKQKLYLAILFVPNRGTVPAALRKKLWATKGGKESTNGICFCCSESVSIHDFHAGHIISVKNGGQTNISNLEVVCSTCNLSMSSKNLLEFKSKHF